MRRTDDRLVQDLAARPVRDGAGADARRRPPAPAVQPDQGRRRRAPPVLGQAGARRRTSPTARCPTCSATRCSVGDRLTMSLPFGDVVLDDSPPGRVRQRGHRHHARWPACSPTWPTAGSHLPITLLHADVDEASFALRQQVLDDVRVAARRLGARLVRARRATARCPSTVHAGQMNLDDVKLPDDAGYYLCGPLPFMQAVRSALIDRGVPARDIQYEVFGPDLWQADLVTEETPGAGRTEAATRRRLTARRARRRPDAAHLRGERSWTFPRCGPTSPRPRPPGTRPRCTSTRTCS